MVNELQARLHSLYNGRTPLREVGPQTVGAERYRLVASGEQLYTLLEAADRIGELETVNANLREAYRNEHCTDCCCARSWKALGLEKSPYTGRSIPEHIADLRRALHAIISDELYDSDTQRLMRATRIARAALTGSPSRPEIPQVPLFTEGRCPNMMHKRYAMLGCTECDATQDRKGEHQ